MHAREGDSARWGRRAAIARAFSGKVEPPSGALTVRGMGWINTLASLTGLASGRTRTDSFSHFTTDMLGLPPLEYTQPGGMAKWTTPDCPPGRDCI